MKISQRLLLLAGAAIAALLVVAGVNLVGSERIYRSANYANDNVVPSLVAIDSAAVSLGRVRTLVYRHALAETPEDKASLATDIDGYVSKLRHALKDSEPLAADEDERTLVQTEGPLVEEYLATLKKILAASNGSDKDALRLQLTHGSNIAQRLTRAFDNHIAYKIKLGQAAAESAASAKQKAVLIGAVITGLVIALLAVLSVGTLRLINRQLAQANAVAERVAGGDLRADEHAPVPGKDEIGHLLQSLERMRVQLAGSLTQVVDAANHLQASAMQLSSSTAQAAAASDHQSQSSSEAAAAIQQLTVSIDQVGSSAAEANDQAEQSRELALSSGARVEAAARQVGEVARRVEFTAEQVGGLSGDVQEIGKITTVIREVAEQTNLLALNAAIEAARAGEQGRGFAVVADEVRKLAERTTNSVQSISTVIQRIQNGSDAVVKSMESSRGVVAGVVTSAEESGQAMQGIVGSADTLREAIASISAALAEQRTASTEVARNVESIAQMSEENSATATELSETARQLLGVAEQLRGSVQAFRL